MGNQSTSGIVEEVNEADEKSQEVCLKEEKQMEIEEDETKDFQEKAAEVDKIQEDDSEDHNGSVNEACETQTNVKRNEPDLEEEGTKLNYEMQDQQCDLQGMMQNPILECTTITSLECTPHEEATEITSEIQEIDTMLEKEISDSGNDHDDGTDSLADAVLETSTDEAELGKNDDHPEEEQINSFDTSSDHQNVGFLEKQNECLAVVEEKVMMNELGNGDTDNTSYVDQETKQSPESVPIEEANELIKDSEIRDESTLEKVVLRPSKSRHIGVEVKLRKSPSFDFGVAFDAKSEESDQTPLLYQDRTPIRSFSSSAKLRFQNKSQAVDMEEKTIRMERSNSMSPPQNMLNKEEIKANANIITQDKIIAYDTKQEHGLLKVSQSTSKIITRRNEKRKPRSSLFTTCICCTSTIS